MRQLLTMLVLAVITGSSLASASVTSPVADRLGATPLAFTQNVGQWPDSILFRASAGRTVMWFTADGIWYQFTRHIRPLAGEEALAAGLGPRTSRGQDRSGPAQPDSLAIALVKAQFVGANPEAEVVGLEEQAYTCNYFLGSDPAKWHAGVPNYSAVTMRGIYPGVDATFRGKDGKLELALSGPAGAVTKVTTAYSGGLVVRHADGSVVVQTKLGEKRFQGYLPVSDDASLTVVESPTAAGNVALAFSTYLGGTNGDEYGYGIAVDGQGCAYVTGSVTSTDFPTQTPYQVNPDGAYGADAFITKFSHSGNSLVYSTYLGGNRDDGAYGIAVDGQGCAYVTGWSRSADFPTQTPFQTYQGPTDSADVFVTKLSASGNSLVYSTYLGGLKWEEGRGIAVDGQGSAYVTGWTRSVDFPTQNPRQTDQPYEDAFVTKLSPSGTSLDYSTYLGGTGSEWGYAIAVDGQGSAFVTGTTASADLPTNVPYQTYQGNLDVFITKLSASGWSLLYSTYLGGAGNDESYGISVDGQSCAYVTGRTNSTNFPTQNAYDASWNTYDDAFVTKLSATGNSLVYSTYLGGSEADRSNGIAVDGQGCAYVTGYTKSDNFPTYLPFRTYPNWYSADAFVTKLSATGAGLAYSTYLCGWNDEDFGRAIAVDVQGSAYVTGYTNSISFPTENPYIALKGYGYDAFVTKLIFGCCVGVTGNVNMLDIVDVSDLSLLVSYLTSNPPPMLPCEAEANVNATGIVDVSDLSLLVAYLTSSPPPILPNCL